MKILKTIVISLLIFSSVAFVQSDVFNDLGVTKNEAQDFILNGVTYGAVSIPEKAKKIPLANRPVVIKAIAAFAKSYVQTSLFKNQYAEWWKGQEPTKPQTPEQKVAERKHQEEETNKQQTESLANIKKQMAETKDPAMKKMYKSMLDASEQAIAATQKPEYKEMMKKMMDVQTQVEAEEYKTKLAEYQTKLTRWQSEKDPSVLIKANLQRLLTETEGIDFAAKLTTNQYGQKVFVNEEYESKSGYWKQAFRAGKPTVDAARVIAKQWLSELK